MIGERVMTQHKPSNLHLLFQDTLYRERESLLEEQHVELSHKSYGQYFLNDFAWPHQPARTSQL